MIKLKTQSIIYEIDEKSLPKNVLEYIKKQFYQEGRINIKIVSQYQIIVQYI